MVIRVPGDLQYQSVCDVAETHQYPLQLWRFHMLSF